jgi:ornithine cyclodeaminase/alanine dehydrogenase-like protein (mu-crystallin family)
MTAPPTLVLTRRDVAALLDLDRCIAAVERAFRRHGEGRTRPPGTLAVHAPPGGFQIRAGVPGLERAYLAAKTNAKWA